MGFKLSLTASAEYAGASVETTMEISTEIENSVTVGSETTFVTTTETPFTAPAGKNYRVLQYVGRFNGQFGSTEACSVFGRYKIEETTGTLAPVSQVQV